MALATLISLYAVTIPSLALPPDQQVECPKKTPAELEAAVDAYWRWSLKAFPNSEEPKSFFMDHLYIRSGISYTPQSRLWGIPFIMFDPKARRDRKYFGIVECNGRVEISIER